MKDFSRVDPRDVEGEIERERERERERDFMISMKAKGMMVCRVVRVGSSTPLPVSKCS